MAARTVKKNEDFGDPFGGETSDEAQTELTNTAPEDTAPWGDQATANKDAGKVTILASPTGESKVTATLKAGAGYDSPWLVFHGSSVTELLEMMSDPNFPKLLTWTTSAAQKFGEGWKPTGNVSDLVKTPATPQGKPEAATNTGNTPYCKHGAMTPRSGFKNGRAWSGHFCPTPQGTPDQCSPKFG